MRYRHRVGGWHYWPALNRYDFSFWWGTPTWGGLTGWFGSPVFASAVPVYYDYGPGGNVIYENNYVYVNGQPVASAAEFAQSAAELATVPPPPNEEVVLESEWMPLGTFALSSSEQDLNPNRILQLAVNRQGIISGTLFHTETERAQTIQGQVDPDTQRVAFRVGENENIVMETGLYNLTQNESPVLVHFGPDWTEEYLLVRLDYPEEGAQAQSY